MGACCGKGGAAPKDPDKAPYGAADSKGKDKGKKKAPPKPPPPMTKQEAPDDPAEAEKEEEANDKNSESVSGHTDHAPEAGTTEGRPEVPVVVADVNDNKPSKDDKEEDQVQDGEKERRKSTSSSSSSSSSASSGSYDPSDEERKGKKSKKKKDKDDDLMAVKLEIREDGDDDKEDNKPEEQKDESSEEKPKSAFLTSSAPPPRPTYTPHRPTFQPPSWYKPSTGVTPPASTFRPTTSTFKTTTSSSPEKKNEDIDPDSIIRNLKAKPKGAAPTPPTRTSSTKVETKEVVTTSSTTSSPAKNDPKKGTSPVPAVRTTLIEKSSPDKEDSKKAASPVPAVRTTLIEPSSPDKEGPKKAASPVPAVRTTMIAPSSPTKEDSKKAASPVPAVRTTIIEQSSPTKEGLKKDASPEPAVRTTVVEKVTVTQSSSNEETKKPEDSMAILSAVKVLDSPSKAEETTITKTTSDDVGSVTTTTTMVTKTEQVVPAKIVNGESIEEASPTKETVVKETVSLTKEAFTEDIVKKIEDVVVEKTITEVQKTVVEQEPEAKEVEKELSTDVQPIDARVIVSNGSASSEEVKEEQLETPASPKTEVEPEPEAEEEEADPEPASGLPAHVANMRKALDELLPSFVPENNAVRETHKLNARAKLVNAIDKWFSGADKDKENYTRAVAVSGKPGIGKTCLAGELCTKFSPQLAGYHFFRYNSANLDHNDPRMVIQAIAHWMCDTFANYTNMLPKMEKLEDLCAHGKVQELFEALITKPLSAATFQHSNEESMLIVLDAIDECDMSTRDSLLETLNKFNELTPEWLYLLVTTKDDNQILDLLDTFKCFEMKATQDSVLDVKRFLREPMSPYMDRISLDGGVSQLAKKSNSSVLCASIYKSQLEAFPEDKKIAMREIDSLFATGLSGVLQQICQQFRTWLTENAPSKEAPALYNTILGTLILAREPILVDFVPYCGSVEPQDVVHQLKHILHLQDSKVSLRHQSIAEWLINGQEAGDYVVDLPTARDYMARFCMTWLRHVLGEKEAVGTSKPQLTAYALKHSIAHFTDAAKQQENIANVLCNLIFLQEKLKLPGVEAHHILQDYKHEHYRLGSDKHVTLEDYMRKHPKHIEQTKSYYKFVQQKIADIKQCPDFLFQVAANYPTVERIQQNARVELSGKPWIEDLTAVADTLCTMKRVVGEICRVDISPDGQMLAMITKDDDYNLKVHMVNPATGDEKVPSVDIKTLPDRVGLAAKFFPDGAHLFVGSLTNFVTTKGKVNPSGYDLSSIQMKEKFSIECCDISPKYVACGVTTFPFGGRSLHMVVFDQKSKKCAKTLEVLKFRFGGSAQFGIKCCAISSNESLLCTAVKQSAKAELKVTLWNIPKWTQAQTVDIGNDLILKCRFVSEDTLLFGGSIRSQLTEDKGIQRSVVWKFKEGESQQPHELDPRELGSVFRFNKGKTSVTRWLSTGGSASHMVWDRVNMSQAPSAIYTIRGLPPAMDVVAFGSMAVYIYSDAIRIYSTADMEVSNQGQKSPGSASVQDVSANSVSFLPRSDTGLVSHSSLHTLGDGLSVSMLGAVQEDMSLTPTVFEAANVNTNAISSMVQDTHRYFRGGNSSGLVCSCTSDSNLVLLNTGSDVKVWDRGTNDVTSLPQFEDLPERFQSEQREEVGLAYVVSPKDSLVAVVYNQLPELIYLFDARTKKTVRILTSTSAVSDFTVMPSTGFIVSYHKVPSQVLVVWNQRNGQKVNEESVHITYARASPASDRLALSTVQTQKEVAVMLRNSDSRFRVSLDVPSRWLPSTVDSDLEFSPDGTILIGVSMETGVCRVWNAGNGEVLRDLDVPLTGPTEIVGMLNNTHAVFHDENLLVVDVASRELVAMLPLEDNLDRNTSPRGLRISPRGNVIIGANNHGQLCVLQCHNFAAVKRKTTLQRMKSFSS